MSSSQRKDMQVQLTDHTTLFYIKYFSYSWSEIQYLTFFDQGIITDEAWGATFPEENTVFLKAIKKTQGGNLQCWDQHRQAVLNSFTQIDYGTSGVQDTHTSLSPIYTLNLQFTHSIKQFIRWRRRPQVQRILRKSRDSRRNTESQGLLIAAEKTVKHLGDLI